MRVTRLDSARRHVRSPLKKINFMRQNVPRALPAEYNPEPSCVNSCSELTKKVYVIRAPEERHAVEGTAAFTQSQNRSRTALLS